MKCSCFCATPSSEITNSPLERLGSCLAIELISAANGDGGAIITNNKKYFTLSKQLRKYGMSKLYYSNVHGINSRLDEVQAAILRVKLKWLDLWNVKRRN